MGEALTAHSVAAQFVLYSFGGGSPFPSSGALAAFLGFFVGGGAATSAPSSAPVAAGSCASSGVTFRFRFGAIAGPPFGTWQEWGLECASEKS